MSWQDRIQRWRVDVKPGAPAPPSVAGDAQGGGGSKLSRPTHRRTTSAPLPPPSVPSSAGGMARENMRAGRQRAMPTTQSPLGRAWEHLRSPQLSRSSGTPPRAQAPMLAAPVIPVAAQPGYQVGPYGYPTTQPVPRVTVVVPQAQQRPVIQVGAGPQAAYYYQAPHPPPAGYGPAPGTSYPSVPVTVLPANSPYAASMLGNTLCPACSAPVPTLELTHHLRMHGWHV